MKKFFLLAFVALVCNSCTWVNGDTNAFLLYSQDADVVVECYLPGNYIMDYSSHSREKKSDQFITDTLHFDQSGFFVQFDLDYEIYGGGRKLPFDEQKCVVTVRRLQGEGPVYFVRARYFLINGSFWTCDKYVMSYLKKGYHEEKLIHTLDDGEAPALLDAILQQVPDQVVVINDNESHQLRGMNNVEARQQISLSIP